MLGEPPALLRIADISRFRVDAGDRLPSEIHGETRSVEGEALLIPNEPASARAIEDAAPMILRVTDSIAGVGEVWLLERLVGNAVAGEPAPSKNRPPGRHRAIRYFNGHAASSRSMSRRIVPTGAAA